MQSLAYDIRLIHYADSFEIVIALCKNLNALLDALRLVSLLKTCIISCNYAVIGSLSRHNHNK